MMKTSNPAAAAARTSAKMMSHHRRHRHHKNGSSTSSTGRNPTGRNEFLPELLQINKSNSGSLSSFSHDGTAADLMSFEDNGSTCPTELSSRPPSATSFLSEDHITAGRVATTAATTKSARPRMNNNNKRSSSGRASVYVMVSGTSFAVPQDALERLQSLDWRCDEGGVFHLETSHAIFEVLLGYVVFETLPAYDTLSKAEYDEFEPMALSLGLYDLIEHFDRSSDRRLRRSHTKRGAKPHKNENRHDRNDDRAHNTNDNDNRRGRRSSFSLFTTKQHKETPIVLNSENVNVTSMKLMAANSKCARFVASLKRKGTEKVLRSRNIQVTHDQLCASDHVD